MSIKNTVLAIILALGFPLTAQAQNAEKFENYENICNSIAECSDFDTNFEQQSPEKQLAQSGRTRRTRRQSPLSKFYIGGHLAPFFPFDGDLDVGFGGGVFAGYKITNNISAEIDIYDYFGGTEVDDLGFNNFGAAVSGVYRYYVSPGNSRSPYIFAGLGIGVGVSSATGDVADDLDDLGVDTSQTGFLLQGKGGVGYPISDKIDLFGQTRFFSIFIEGEDADGLALDFGAIYNF